MKTCLVRTMLLIASFFYTISSSGQTQLDVLFHGPWMFYIEPTFADGMGKVGYVLVAIAPANAGHDAPLFTTGQGNPISSAGFYCVAFAPNTCPDSAMSNTLNNGNYPTATLLSLKKPTDWDWIKLPKLSNPLTPTPMFLYCQCQRVGVRMAHTNDL